MKRTPRGFAVFTEFTDIYRNEVRVQQSSSAEGNYVWIFCNPAHLYLGTRADNTADVVARKRSRKCGVTHCPRGHAYDDQNTYTYRGSRSCRACARIEGAIRRSKNRGEHGR